MIRLYAVVATCAVVLICDFLGQHYVSAGIGIVIGGGMLLVSTAKGGATRPIGLAAPHLMKGIPKRSGDPSANIGCAIAAMGIGSFGDANGHYPYPFRVFYGVCTILGAVIAVVIAIRSRSLVVSEDERR
jgi:hypothetical protein